MFSSIGRESRLARLGAPDPVNLVALDHGLSLGWTQSQDSPADIARDCCRLGLQGVVCHVGMLDKIKPARHFAVFLQLHGSTPTDNMKAELVTPDVAIYADCIGVAVEYQASGGSSSMANTAKLVQAAQNAGLITLIMANYRGEDYSLASQAVVGAAQLGADYIKLRIPQTEPTPSEIHHLRRIIEDSPPTLVAGGEPTSSLNRTLGLARRVGMRGSCIGRHYFDCATRTKAVATVMGAFHPTA